MNVTSLHRALGLFAGLTAITVALPSIAHAQTYVYSGGAQSKQPGSSCRAATKSSRDKLRFNDDGSVTNTSTSASAMVYCPFERRNTSAYGQSPGFRDDAKLGPVVARITDG